MEQEDYSEDTPKINNAEVARTNFDANLDLEINKSNIADYISDQEVMRSFPQYVGINFNDSLIVDGRVDWSEEKIRNLSRDKNISSEYIDTQIERNKLKVQAYEEYLDGFHDRIGYARVHPFVSQSPIAPSQAVEHSLEGSKINISPSFIKQMIFLKSHCENVTLVVPFYNDEKIEEYCSDVPQDEAYIDEYIAICSDLIDKLGSDIVIELGNETNVCHQTSQEFNNETRLAFASHVDSVEYAKFYFEASRRIKSEHPEVRLSIAGTAGYDEAYLEQALATINQLRVDNKVGANLVDVISFHPYGDNPVSGALMVNNGRFVQTNLNFNKQLESMQLLADRYGTELQIGEINYPKNDPNQKKKLNQFVANSSQHQVITMIWPTASM